MLRSIVLTSALVLLASAGLGAQAPPADPPLDLDHREEVQVRLVLLDVVVQDRRGRTVPGLGREDFDVLVDWEPVVLESLDAHCPIEAARDPRAGEPPFPAGIKDLPGPVRRIVFAFDYFHLASVPAAIDGAREALADAAPGGEELMVVSIGEALRVEQPFTSDRGLILDALDRMKSDVSLFAGNYSRLTEFPVLERFRMIFDLLEPVPGRKVVVLFSGPFQNDGFEHDPDFRAIAALSTASRVALYTVDSRGLTVPKRFRHGDFGPPPGLSRLAVETGGRVTFNTNDLGLGYARAQRDLACTYTLGFRDRSDRTDETRDLRVFVRRRNVRVVHPSAYIFRSAEARRASLIRTARMTPEMFAGDGLQAAVLPIMPAGRNRWLSLLAVRIRPAVVDDGSDPGGWKLDGALRSPSGAVVTAFEQGIAMRRAGGAGERPPSLTYLETVELKPGRYRLGVVLSHPSEELPRAGWAEAELPEIPSNGPFLVGPWPGRRADASSVLRGGDEDGGDPAVPRSFEPLLDGRLESGEELGTLTYLCATDSPEGLPAIPVALSILSEDLPPIERRAPVPLLLEGERNVRCYRFLDWLPARTLNPGRHTVSAVAGTESDRIEHGTDITVEAPSPVQPAGQESR